jgi:amidase
MSIGADQAGSIRVPSSWSGIVGLKPTFGLVPYTGASSLEYTIDHLGPMARNVGETALLLEVLAGPDGLDSRQTGARPGEYVHELAGGARGLRVGLVAEGFGWPGASEEDVDALVEEAAHGLEHAGAAVSRVSVPLHRDGMSIFMGIGVEGTTRAIADGHGMGFGWKGFYTRTLMAACSRGLDERADALSPVTKLVLVLGRFLRDTTGGQYYAKAQNHAIALRRAYDDALREADVLVMPTTPMKARPLPAPGASVVERIARAMEGIANTSPFNVTGHPALSVPCGSSDGLPVGMMLVGRHGEDGTVLRAGHAHEQTAR